MTKNNFVCDCDIIHEEVVAAALSKMPSDEILDGLAQFYKVLGNVTRTKICFALSYHEMCVCDLANVLSMSKSSVSHQLRILREYHIVRARQVGKEVYYKLDDNHVRRAFNLGLRHSKHQKKEDDVEK